MTAELYRLVAADEHVATIAWRLQTAGAAVCVRQQLISGLVVGHISQYEAEVQPLAAALLNLREWPTVIAVVPESAAALAGIMPRDEIMTVNGRSLLSSGTVLGATHDDRVHALIVSRLRLAFNAGPVEMVVRRGQELLAIRFAGTRACQSDVELDLRDDLDAMADGQVVTLWQGLLGFVQNDDELAFVLAHEVAHNVLGHNDIARSNSAGALSGIRNSKLAERQADYLGLYLVARAGYDVRAAAGYMESLGKAMPDLLLATSHPGARIRAESLAAEAAEIMAKRVTGRPLVPNSLPH